MSRLRKALVFSVLTQYSIQVIGIVSIAILARLLTPAEIGVYAIAASVGFLAVELQSLGVQSFLIREKDIDASKMRSALGLMILVAWGLALLIAIAAEFVAEFYNEEALATIFLIIAATFLLAPFTGLTHALLARSMQFDSLFKMKFFSNLIRAGSSIGFVVLGYSYYGLAMGALAGSIAELAIISLYRPAGTPWMPTFRNIKSIFHFGIYTSTSNAMQQFSFSIPDLVLGRVATMTDVGLFSRGLGVIVFLNNILTKAVAPVALPHFSEVRRSGASVADSYLRAISLFSVFAWPIFVLVNLFAFSLINALFGDQWDASVPIASVMAIWAMLMSAHSFSSHMLLAIGHEKLMFKKELIIFATRLLAVILGAPHGMIMVAWAMVLSGVVEFCINSWVTNRVLEIDLRRMLLAYMPSFIVAIVCWVSLSLADSYIDFKLMNPWVSLAIVGCLALPVWLLSVKLTRHQAWAMVEHVVKKTGLVRQ